MISDPLNRQGIRDWRMGHLHYYVKLLVESSVVCKMHVGELTEPVLRQFSLKLYAHVYTGDVLNIIPQVSYIYSSCALSVTAPGPLFSRSLNEFCINANT